MGEAAWACRLDASLSVFQNIAQTAAGAVLLAENRIFTLLAYCPLIHYAVLPPANSGQFPAAYAWPQHTPQGTRAPVGAPWRRPLQVSWCRALALVATLLASAPELGPQASVVLEVFEPRLRHLFRSGLQTGHMAILEEAAVACRLLALMPRDFAAADRLLADAATHALAFVIGTCLTERSNPSEIFMPVSLEEQLSAQVDRKTEAATLPAVVPSVFHQRLEYITLDLLQSMLSGLLKATSSPAWLNNAASWDRGPAWSAAPQASPGDWPSTPSLMGLRVHVCASGTEPGGQQHRLWTAVMDVALEGGRRVAGLLASLSRRGQHLYVGDALADTTRDAERLFIPLSLALATLNPQETETITLALTHNTAGRGPASPGGLARSLTPPMVPKSPRLAVGLSPPSSPSSTPRSKVTRKRGERAQGQRYQHMALRPHCTLGGQCAHCVVPEYVSLAELRKLCNVIVEMSCTLLFHFCKAMGTGTLAGQEQPGPSVTVLHGLLSFLQESRMSGLDAPTLEFLTKLGDALHVGYPSDDK